MHLFRSSKRSKDARSVSPAPSPRSTQTPTASAARFRRRQPDTILPLHGTPPTLAWKKQGNNSNFLYGGQFYPEGRRRRKIRRDYPLWQQIFCSSPTRMLITLLVLTYVSLLYVVWPLLHFLMQQLSSHGSTIVRGRDLLLHHSYSSESLAHIDALYDAIQRIPPPPSLTTRSEFLQQMYPQFYHRNSERKSERPIRSLLAPDHRRPHCPTPQSDTLQQVTLVIQTTIHRLPVVQETCRRWKSSPMIVVVALSEDDEDFSSIIDSYDCPNTQWISYHLPSSTLDYPVNHLRNLALEAVSTSHVLVVDADFVPSIALEQAIVQNLPALSPRQAMVIPAFERIMECNHQNDCLELLQHNSSFIPRTMMELETCMQAHDCRVFQANNNPEGHSSTRSHEWLYDPHKELRTIECFDSLRYEPYLVLPWCANDAVPYYDERFHGYGKNKIQHVQHVRFLGFSFAVLPPQGFLVHAPHPESAVKEEWNNVKTSSLHRDMDALYREFLHELVEESRTNMVDVHSIVGPCESS
ncbi:glycosyltransferase-like protein LARGE [Fistulifera solaris]|uniref:Glycosyltransferase-like protein LARGE n=1 Tax=Fistulifera solaris TaxID=1519565 RepID=A0A1Z5JXQ2_FISSO|nr:glycosyltransferase-like protein LARGE [Fistulifera solaris]|eukprot:GAX18608.1 glycosyltransferase-like protein LARGE [Fistulifera solaris]